MDGLPFDEFFEWIQQVVENRWGKFWGWTVFTVLLLLFVGGAIWIVFRR